MKRPYSRRRRARRRWCIAVAIAVCGPPFLGAGRFAGDIGPSRTFAAASEREGEPLRIVHFALDAVPGDSVWGRPAWRAGYRVEKANELRLDQLRAADVLLLETGGGALRPRAIERLARYARAGMRLVVHDPGGRHLKAFLGDGPLNLLPGTGAETAGWRPRAGRGWTLAGAARRTLLQQGPAGLLEELPPGDFATHFGLIDPSLPPESTIVPILEEPGAGLVAVCQPQGRGAVVYSVIELSAFLRWRQDSRSGLVLRERYAPNLLAWAAWGACNPATSAVPLEIDVLPGDPDNRIRRRGVRVALLSTNLVDASRSIDRTSIRFGKTGEESSLYRCTERGGDLNGDGLADLTCVFVFDRTGITRGDPHVRLTARTLDGRAVRGIDTIQLDQPG